MSSRLEKIPNQDTDEEQIVTELEPQPLLSLTVLETTEGPKLELIRDKDKNNQELRIDIYTDRNTATRAAAWGVIHELLLYKPSEWSMLLATGNTQIHFFKSFQDLSQQIKFSLDLIKYGHLDNYVFPKSDYPDGPGKNDFSVFIKDNFLTPANIDVSQFYAIDSWDKAPEKIARDYENLLENKLKPKVVIFGLGPKNNGQKIPEVHLAFMRETVNLEQGVHVTKISETTKTRNAKRGEKTPDLAITIGPKNILSITKLLKGKANKFVLAFGSAYSERVASALLNPISMDTVATLLRREEYRSGTRYILDLEASTELLKHLSK